MDCLIPVDDILARIMHKFSTASPKAPGLTVLRLRRPPQRTIQYACGGLGRAWRNALRPALSPLRDENLSIIRACDSSPQMEQAVLIIRYFFGEQLLLRGDTNGILQ